MTKTAEDSVKEAATRKHDQYILLKVQDTDLTAREAHYKPAVGEITLERMTDTRKPSKTLKSLKSKLPTRPYIFSTSFSILCAESFIDKEITTLRTIYETGTFHASFLLR